MTMKSQESSQSVNDNNSPNDGADKDVVIAVMGITGAGKSYFIRQITGNDEVTVGVSQVSCKSTTLLQSRKQLD
jgi:Fe-S cluster assembly ATPase SufC